MLLLKIKHHNGPIMHSTEMKFKRHLVLRDKLNLILLIHFNLFGALKTDKNIVSIKYSKSLNIFNVNIVIAK